MKRILLSILLITLSGCSDTKPNTDESSFDELLECIAMIEEEPCEQETLEELFETGMTEYTLEQGYDFSNYVVTGHLSQYDDREVFYVEFASVEIALTTEILEDAAAITDELFEEMQTIFEDYSIIVLVDNNTEHGDETIRYEKFTNSSETDLFIFKRVDEMTINLLSDNKDFIESVLSETNEYRIHLTLNYTDSSIEDFRKDHMSFSLQADQMSATIEYRLFHEYSLVEIDFEPQALYDRLPIEFPQYVFEYLE